MVRPWIASEIRTTTYVIVTKISLFIAGSSDKARAMEIPPRSPPHVMMAKVWGSKVLRKPRTYEGMAKEI
jgi:hypothetical protein